MEQKTSISSSAIALASLVIEGFKCSRLSPLRPSMQAQVWYFENQTAAIEMAIQKGAFIGASGEGRIAAASRFDYAAATAAVLTELGFENSVLELGGDNSYTRAGLAAELSRQTGKVNGYHNLSEAGNIGTS
jgi:NAD(P)H dehydrogenase (quinone)